MMGKIKGCSCVGRTFPQTSKLRFLRTQPSQGGLSPPSFHSAFLCQPSESRKLRLACGGDWWERLGDRSQI